MANIIGSGNFNVSIEQMFTPLTIISLVQATVIVIQKYGHCVKDIQGMQPELASKSSGISTEQYDNQD